MQCRSGEKTSHIETIITKGIKFSPLQAGSRIGLAQSTVRLNTNKDDHPGVPNYKYIIAIIILHLCEDALIRKPLSQKAILSIQFE